jgi:hypothetical protein
MAMAANGFLALMVMPVAKQNLDGGYHQLTADLNKKNSWTANKKLTGSYGRRCPAGG